MSFNEFMYFRKHELIDLTLWVNSVSQKSTMQGKVSTK